MNIINSQTMRDVQSQLIYEQFRRVVTPSPLPEKDLWERPTEDEIAVRVHF